MQIPTQFPDTFIATLADVDAIERTPWQELLTARSTYALIRQGASLNPDAPAIYFIPDGDHYDQPEIMTYRALLRGIHQTANLFHDLDLKSTDVIVLLLPNLPTTHAIIWGGQATGIVYPINYLLEAPQIVELMKAAGVKALVALGPSSQFAIWEKVEYIRRELPDLLVLQVAGEAAESGVHHYDALVGNYPDDRLVSGREIAPGDICAYFATGGTTGQPKIAMHTHLNETFEAWVMSLVVNRRSEDSILCGLPLFHVNAVHITGLAPFAVGASVVLLGMQGFRDKSVIRNFWKIVERFRATSFGGVPTLYASLLDVPLDGADISSLKHVRCGAAPMPVEVFKTFEARTGIKIIEGYGLTEGACSSTGNPPYGERRIGSVGLRYPYQQVKTAQLDANGCFLRDCLPDEIGHVIMKGPQVFAGYLNPAHNRGIWVDDGWMKTGDLGRMDADGYLWITGRAKDLIIRGGHNIDPAVIEEALYQHEAVALAAAVGKPDTYAGEIPAAYVQLKPGFAVSESELLEFVRGRITERAALPKSIYVLDKIPLTPVGKLYKLSLRHDAARRAYQEALDSANIAAQVEVLPDSVHGMVARIALDSGSSEDQAKVALAGFAVHLELIQD